MKAEKGDGLREVPTTDAERSNDPLSADEIWKLVQVGKKIALFFGAPQDIEFVVDPASKLWVVQARPVTRIACLTVRGSWHSGFAFKSWLAMTLSSVTGYFLSKTLGVNTKLTEEEVLKPFFGVAFVSRDLTKLAPHSVDLEVVRAYTAHALEMEPLLWRLINGLSTVPTTLLHRAVAGMLRERVELGFLSFSTGAECRSLEKQMDEDLLLAASSRPESSLHVHEMEKVRSFSLRFELFLFEKTKKIALELRKHPVAMEKLAAGRYDEFMNDPFFALHVEAYLRQFFFHCALDEDVRRKA